MNTPRTNVPLRARRTIAGVGRVLLWNGGSVWLGRDVGRAEIHAHYAIQITLALEGDFLIRSAGDSAWQRTLGAIVMSDHQHEFDGCGSTLAVIFVEPESSQGRSLRALHGTSISTELPMAEVKQAIDALKGAFEARGSDALLLEKAQAAVHCVAGDHAPAGAHDVRIETAMQWVRSHLREEIALEDAAASVHLSASRFRHLFVAQTGISFRAYLRWARVESAVAAAFSGKTWTQAAQDAGFADSAHLSRTCRRMFGLSPAMLVPER